VEPHELRELQIAKEANERLRAEIAELKAMDWRELARLQAETVNTLSDEKKTAEDYIESLKAENERLRSGLEQYGLHKHTCISRRIMGAAFRDRSECDCGLGAALRASEPKE